MPRPLVAAIALLAAQPSCRDPRPAEAPAEPPAKVTVTTTAPRLESFTDLELPGVRTLDMIADESGWRPAVHIDMPHHHATRIELTNLADFPELAGRHDRPMRFTLEFTTRDIVQVPGRHAWRATYHARILAVHAP